jgi:hypothetical protein
MSQRASLYRWCHGPNGEMLYGIGILADGSLRNPHGYPDDVVRAAVLAADARCRARRSGSAKKAAETRRQRQLKRTATVAQKILAGHGIGARQNCAICGRGLGDPVSIARGVGSECWQDVLNLVSAASDGDVP